MDKVYLPGWRRGLVMWWKGVCSDIWLLRRRYHFIVFIVDEILNLMTQSEAQISIMPMLLIEGTILGWVVCRREGIW